MSHLVQKRWVPDEESEHCGNCNDQFSWSNRKHHCRSCGRLLCGKCCAHWMLISKDKIISPPDRVDDCTIPQKCCESCSRFLQTEQDDLRAQYSRSNRELNFIRESPERYMNIPISMSMQTDIRKATYTLYNFTADNKFQGQDTIPRDLIREAKGIALITVVKAGLFFTARIGTGIVIAKQQDGTWSAPSAVIMSGVGWGFQAGGELIDIVLLLTTDAAVRQFCSQAQVTLGTELSVSIGPVGRAAGTDLHGSQQGTAAAFSYAHSKGLFFGLSLEASVIATRDDVNRQFYGMEVKPSDLLYGRIPRPQAAIPLYTALSEVITCGDRRELTFDSVDPMEEEGPLGSGRSASKVSPSASGRSLADSWTNERAARLQRHQDLEFDMIDDSIGARRSMGGGNRNSFNSTNFVVVPTELKDMKRPCVEEEEVATPMQEMKRSSQPTSGTPQSSSKKDAHHASAVLDYYASQHDGCEDEEEGEEGTWEEESFQRDSAPQQQRSNSSEQPKKKYANDVISLL